MQLLYFEEMALFPKRNRRHATSTQLNDMTIYGVMLYGVTNTHARTEKPQW